MSRGDLLLEQASDVARHATGRVLDTTVRDVLLAREVREVARESPRVLAAALLAALVGWQAERATVRARRPEHAPVEDWGRLPGRERAVVSDGTPLYVVEDGPDDADLAVVLVHGWTAQLPVFDPQRRQLAHPRGEGGLLDRPLRAVLFDHRGHGRSARGRTTTYTIDQLGHDLGVVLDATLDGRPCLLVGHSMGGMTIMALAEQRPELFGPDGVVRGVGLLSTSAGGLPVLPLPERLTASTAVAQRLQRWLPWYADRFSRAGPLLDPLRPRGTDLGWMLTRFAVFSPSTPPDPGVVELALAMVEDCGVDVAAAFSRTFLDHDKVRALPALARVESLVACGEQDLLTPPNHSELLAERLGERCELLLVPEAGHALPVEQPEALGDGLVRLVERVRAAG